MEMPLNIAFSAQGVRMAMPTVLIAGTLQIKAR